MYKKVAIKFKRGDWPWPPRSPDLAIYDFFLWGYLKHSIWNVPMNNQPKNLRELRNAIQRECANLNRDLIRRAFTGMISRAQRCMEVRGHTFPNE